METKNDGGPAFPVTGEDHLAWGITMRDYFAAKAMQGFAASPSMIDSSDSRAVAYVAAVAYAMADAMLMERAK